MGFSTLDSEKNEVTLPFAFQPLLLNGRLSFVLQPWSVVEESLRTKALSKEYFTVQESWFYALDYKKNVTIENGVVANALESPFSLITFYLELAKMWDGFNEKEANERADQYFWTAMHLISVYMNDTNYGKKVYDLYQSYSYAFTDLILV